jgi:hypothetical protein
LLHNAVEDNSSTPGRTYDTYIFSQDLENNKNYKIKYTVTTINGLTVATPSYRIS